MYTAVVLTEQSRNQLLQELQGLIPDGYDIVAHHMTICMADAQSMQLQERLGEEVELQIIEYDLDQRVVAVKVQTEIPSKNVVKHITVAVNKKEGGKPVHSNQLSNWRKLSTELAVRGYIQEIY